MRTLALLVIWEIWKERNSRVLRHHGHPVHEVMTTIKNEAIVWIRAGATHFGEPSRFCINLLGSSVFPACKTLLYQ
ncbi:hypothetical protein HU200_010798 [Digitaria exilis]|uniref:Uncharacterized protein n=1 Tax=Digitaria exilis TaxID=1010633 RepID=A0A835FIB7_9POAL|nr:hypothetical protein HU200_010798 [Digitaria exilis]